MAKYNETWEECLVNKCGLNRSDFDYYDVNGNKLLPPKASRITWIYGSATNGEDAIVMIFTIRDQGGWKIHSEGNRTGKSDTVPLRDKAVEMAGDERKYFAFAVCPEDISKKGQAEYDLLQEYVVSIESSSYGNETAGVLTDCIDEFIKYNLAKTVPEKIYRTELTTIRGKYTIAFVKKDSLVDYIKFFDNRPYQTNVVHVVDYFYNALQSSGQTTVNIDDIWPQNFLIAGAPGTGKSYKLNEQIIRLIREEIYYTSTGNAKGSFSLDDYKEYMLNELKTEENLNEVEKKYINRKVRRVTFYEDYYYDNFIGSYKPVPGEKEDTHDISMEQKNNGSGANVTTKIKGTTSGETVTYEFEPGPFIETYVDAVNNEERFFLVIEEINRAKAASVFGDMFQLLDRKNGESEYTVTPDSSLDKYLQENIIDYDGTMKLPSNMYIWATMNNADQGVFPLDSAFKRRWGYLYLDVDTSNKDGDICISDKDKVRWNIFRHYLNSKILEHSTEDKCIGAYYFKDEEFDMIGNFFDPSNTPEDRKEMINPLSDKLLIYLLNDICRNNPSLLFKEGYYNMPEIRSALRSGLSLENILDIDWNSINKETADYYSKSSINAQNP